eukprot:gene7021-biopygen18002
MGACRRWEHAADGSMPQMGACRRREHAADGSMPQMGACRRWEQSLDPIPRIAWQPPPVATTSGRGCRLESIVWGYFKKSQGGTVSQCTLVGGSKL